jgi:hypothetical protein
MTNKATLLFYRDKDYSAIQDNIDLIVEKSIIKQHQILDPKDSEYSFVKSLVLEYIKTHNRVIYGGSAYHAIIEDYKKRHNIEAGSIYKSYEYYDIEFYSPDPIGDVIKLTNILHNKGIKYVMGREAQHEETYTVFANFYQYCDISFMEARMFNNIPYINIDDAKYIDPSFMLVDILRQFNDPLTSYWRLEKIFKRTKLLLMYSELEFKKPKQKLELEVVDKELNRIINYFMIEIIKKLKKVVFIGDICYLIYSNPEKKVDSKRLSKIEFYSRNLKTDIVTIIDIINKYCATNNLLGAINKLFKINKFYKFFQFWDTKVIVYYKNKPLLILFGNNHRCIPCRSGVIDFTDTDKKSEELTTVKIGSFMVNINYFLISYHYYKIYQSIEPTYVDLYKKYWLMIETMLDIRNKYLDEVGKTVIDKSLYEEFIINCLGKTMEFTREYLVKMYAKRKKKQKRITFIYDPNESNSITNAELSNYKHKNTTGLVRRKINL